MQTTRANAAIFFHPEGFSTSASKLMGRHAAGEGFLSAFMQSGEVETLLCHCAQRAHADAFAALRDAQTRPRVPVRWIPLAEARALEEVGTLQVPSPALAEHAWRRRRAGGRGYSLCGLTHTISSHGAMQEIVALVDAPLENWDALVCTSSAVLNAVRRLLDAQADYLRERFGALRIPRPQLALIPLGVDCAARAPDPAKRADWRGRLGIEEDDVAFLFVGRLSFHAKANPGPMYMALERAASRSKRRLHLVQAGWFANDVLRDEFVAGARALCPSVNVSYLDGRLPDVRADVWHAADVFTSLSDNVQETFGLTPIEAMAHALPSVVSDWNGYRDTVREGIDGYRIPTIAPAPGGGSELAARHAEEVDSYDRYIGYASLCVSVDVAACADAYARLAADPGLRRRMGAEARSRACERFDWRRVVREYQALWAALAKQRHSAEIRAMGLTPADPRRADPFWLFQDYPSRTLAAGDPVWLAPEADGAVLAARRQLGLFGFGRSLLMDDADCDALLAFVERTPGRTVRELVDQFAPGDAARAQRTLAWLNKMDLIRLEQSPAGPETGRAI